jgi:hypothetical protein
MVRQWAAHPGGIPIREILSYFPSAPVECLQCADHLLATAAFLGHDSVVDRVFRALCRHLGRHAEGIARLLNDELDGLRAQPNYPVLQSAIQSFCRRHGIPPHCTLDSNCPGTRGWSQEKLHCVLELDASPLVHCRSACRSGRLQLLKRLRQSREPWPKDLPEIAAKFGHVPVLEWLSVGRLLPPDLYKHAILGGQLPVLQWLYARNRQSFPAYWLAFAAGSGHLPILEWALSMGMPLNEDACCSAAQHGRLNVLEWLRERDVPWNAGTCAAAANHGHLELLKWLRARGCPWSASTCELAARRGHLAVLQWARDNGCPWDECTTAGAVANGEVEVLRYLDREGCTFYGDMYSLATDDETKRFLVERKERIRRDRVY